MYSPTSSTRSSRWSSATSEYGVEPRRNQSPGIVSHKSNPESTTSRSYHQIKSPSYKERFSLKIRKGGISRWFLMHFQVSPYDRRIIIGIRAAIFITTLLAFIVHSISTITPLNVLTFSEVAQAFPTYLTPAVYTVIMWSLVFLSQALSNIYMMVPASYSSIPLNVGYSYFPLISNIFLISWIFSWLFQVPNTIPSAFPTVVIWFSLTVLVVTEVRMAKGFSPAETWLDYFAINMPNSILSAWILSEALNGLFIGAGGWLRPEYDGDIRSIILGFSISTIVAFGCMVLAYLIIGRNPAFGLIYAWSTIGISVRNFQIHEGEDGEEANYQVAVTSCVMGVIIILGSLGIGGWNIWDIVKGKRLTWRHTGNYLHV